jgi:hypothetical protein
VIALDPVIEQEVSTSTHIKRMSTGSQTCLYRGSTVDELIPRIQRELGSDAIILRRREGLAGGILGFFQRSFVEIEAIPGGPRIDVYDEGEGEPASLRPPAPGLPLLDVPRTAPVPSFAREAPAPVSAYAGAISGGGAVAAHGAYVTEQLAALATAARSEPMPERPRESRPTIPQRHGPRSPCVPDSSAVAAPALGAAESRLVPSGASAQPWSVPPVSRERTRAGVSIEKRLVGVGMSESFAREMIEVARTHMLPLAPGGGLTRGVRAALAQRIPVAPPLPLAGSTIAIVGAGGSGKTSCCAVLMRAYRRAGTLPAGYAALTWEAERPGLHMLLSPHVMWPTPVGAHRSLRALRRVRGEGLLVIDTPPLSPADHAGVRELASLLGELTPQRVVVALPATLGATAAAQLLEMLRPLGANAVAVTHADETDQIGVAVEAACRFGLAPEYRLDRGRASAWRIGRIDPAGLAEWLLP